MAGKGTVDYKPRSKIRVFLRRGDDVFRKLGRAGGV